MTPKPKIMEALAAPFPADRIKFRVGARNDPKTRGIALPYVDARDYYARLNEVLGLDWEDEELITYDAARVTVKYRLTLRVGDETRTRTGDGECADLRDENAVTTAAAQAFKRACVKFGLGADLYELPRQWVDIKNERYIPGRTKNELRRAYARWIETDNWTFGSNGSSHGRPTQPKKPLKQQSDEKVKEDHGAITLSFGKYKGQTLQQVLQEDPEYFKYLADKAAGMTLNFGKYQGQKLQQVLQEDPDYIAYLADKAYDDEVRQAAASMSLAHSV